MFSQDEEPANADSLGRGTNHGLIELEPQDLCYIDEVTAKTLELLENNADTSNRKHSLFGLLNACTSTTTGSRLLREGLLRPLCHLNTLEHRLDCIEYLIDRVDTLGRICSTIKGMGQCHDLDRIVPYLSTLVNDRASTLSAAERRLDALTALQSLVSQAVNLTTILQESDQRTLMIYKNALQDPAYDEILGEINHVIDTEVKAHRGKRAKMFRIKSGVESLFDIARSTYNAAINDLEQYVIDLQREDSIPWKLSYGESRGYYLSVSTDHIPKTLQLSSRYMKVAKNRTTISCTTRELMQSNVRANISYENSMKLANEILVGTIQNIMANAGAITKLVEIVGTLDLVTSFAKFVSGNCNIYVRPRFTATDTAISRARHPVLESVLNENNLPFVPNDIVFSTGHKNFALITGPNMGGKSIYLKQVAIIQIMAQMGCYVPADSAHIKLMNRIVARSGTTDDAQSSCSSFMWELKGISSALQREPSAPNQSVLYAIDEVGRGTSIDDGASYSFAIAEELASRDNCFTVYATHFVECFHLTKLYPNIAAYHFKYDDDAAHEEDPNQGLKVYHGLVPGFGTNPHYGIRLAQAIGLPQEIIKTAKLGLNYDDVM